MRDLTLVTALAFSAAVLAGAVATSVNDLDCSGECFTGLGTAALLVLAIFPLAAATWAVRSSRNAILLGRLASALAWLGWAALVVWWGPMRPRWSHDWYGHYPTMSGDGREFATFVAVPALLAAAGVALGVVCLLRPRLRGVQQG